MIYLVRTASILCLGLVFVLGGCEKLTPQQQHFDSGFKAYKSGDFATALLFLKPLVESGHPAAQLLLAKMYSQGQGVTQDMAKAELLRNIASYQVYKKKDITPGEMRPANETLKEISDRLDYMVDSGEGKKGVPQDLGKALESMDLKGLVEIQKLTGDSEAPPNDVAIDIPREVPGETTAEPPAPSQAQIPREVSNLLAPTLKMQDSRRNEQISLGLIRQAAEAGDPMAVELLAAAYSNGFYGLTPSTTQAALWTEKFNEVRHHGPRSAEIDPLEKVPLAQVWSIVGLGIGLGAVGIWRWRQSRLG